MSELNFHYMDCLIQINFLSKLLYSQFPTNNPPINQILISTNLENQILSINQPFLD